MKYPRHPEMMKRRMERMKPFLGIMARVPAILVLESKMTLKAYYGSYFRAGLILIWESIYLGSKGLYWGWVYEFCDFVGWTQLRKCHPDSKHLIRHGGNCTYYNCSDPDCVDKSIPVWFRKLTRML